MPERDGNTLPSEQTHFNLQGIEKRNKLADELLNLGLKGLNRIGRLPFALESSIFMTANKDYQQAVECFRYGLYEPAMVMARGTIDDALYLSKYHIIDKIEGYDKGMGGSISGHILTGKSEWKKLEKEAKVLSIDWRSRLQMQHIRDRYGNFSAHIAARQVQENRRYARLSEDDRRRFKKPKWSIDENTAYQVLKQTARFLVYIRRTRVRKYQTLTPVHY